MKEKTIEAWAIVNKRGKMIVSGSMHYWIFTTKREAKFYSDEDDKVKKVEIKLLNS